MQENYENGVSVGLSIVKPSLISYLEQEEDPWFPDPLVMEQKVIMPECDTEFPDVTIKLEQEEKPWVRIPQTFPIIDSGNPEVEIKQEQKEVPETLDYPGFEENANVDQSGFHGISIKVEVKEETFLPDFQASEENVAVLPFRSDIGCWKENDYFPSDSAREVETRRSGLGIAKGRHFQYPKKANVSASDCSAEGLHRNASGKRMGDEINESKLQNTTHRFRDWGITAPKKAEEVGKRERILLEVKKEIIRKYEQGLRVTELAKEYARTTSTIVGILKIKEKIMATEAAKGVTRISRKRTPVLEHVEKLLLVWIQDKQRAGDTVTDAIICEKAKALHGELQNKQPGTSTNAEDFRASKGWFERFKARSGIHSVVRHREAASCDVPAAEDFAIEFLELIGSEGYLPQQVFNCDETCLFWKRMPKRTFIMEEARALPGQKLMQDRLTLLFCANASGDLKIKPLLVYHSANPRAFKNHKVDKNRMGVFWRSTPTAWVTRLIFVEWVNSVFGPAVKQYLVAHNLPLKAMLLMDNAPAHPPSLEEDLRQEYRFIKVVFLPPNTTPLLQPMNQQVITNFKKLYMRELFRRCVEMMERTNLTLYQFWKDHFDIVGCLSLITRAWDGVTQRNLISAWYNLWPGCVEPLASSPAPEQESSVVQEIVSMGRSMGLEMTEDEINELVEGHDCELEEQDVLEASSEEEEVVEMRAELLSTAQLKEICYAYEILHRYAPYHSDKAEGDEVVNIVETRYMPCFRQVLKRRQRQQTLDRLLKKTRNEEEPGCFSAAQLPSSFS